MVFEAFGRRLLRVMVLLVAVAAIVALSALTSSYLVTKQLATLLKPNATAAVASKNIEPETLVEVDFYEASGINPDDLRTFLEDAAARDHLDE